MIAFAQWSSATSRIDGSALATSLTTDLAGFAALAFEWDALVDRSEAGRYFLRHHWTFAWWQHYAPRGAQLFIVTCRDAQGRLVGVAPLYADHHPVLGVPAVRELRLLGTGVDTKTSEHLDFLTERGYERQVCTALWQHLTASNQWDRIWMHQVPATSPNLAYIPTTVGDVIRRSCDQAPYIDTSAGWDAYKQSLGRSMRRNVEYYKRRLFKEHNCEFSLVEPAQLDEALTALVRLHQAKWHAIGEAGAFSCRSLEPFLRQAARQGLAKGHTRLWTLRIDGRIDAALIGFLDRGVLHYFQKGFNHAFAANELGNVIVALCVRACCDDPAIAAFDFMGGGAPYKALWARQSTENVLIEIRRPSIRAALFDAQRRLQHQAISILRTITPMPVRAARRRYRKEQQLKRSQQNQGNSH